MRSAVVVVVLSLAIASVASAGGGRATVGVAKNATLKTSILVDQKGLTLYLLVDDSKDGKPHCAGIDPTCPKNWPALATTGAPRAGAGVNAHLLGTVKGAGGVRQVTYNGHPLYHFVGDHVPGDVFGQGCVSLWYVLTPAGKPYKKGGRPC
jgi:predicted lipoprotein with Yx(FWY)xxD motif